MSIYSSIPTAKRGYSKFPLNHEVKMSFNFGGIYPILTQRVLPGDKWKVNVQDFIRTVPLISPVMHRADLKLDAFFVPSRLIFPDIETMLSDPEEGAGIEFPFVDDADKVLDEEAYKAVYGPGSLADYFNMATNTLYSREGSYPENGGYKLSLEPFRAYQLIWNEYFRNETLEAEIPIDTESGTHSFTALNNGPYHYSNFLLRNRNWRRDMFTASLPTPQRGPAVLLPGAGDVVADGALKLGPVGGDLPTVPSEYGLIRIDGEVAVTSDTKTRQEYRGGLKVENNSVTLEDLRYAEALQEAHEASARSGHRFKEFLQSFWAVRSSDSRLQRPEYLGGFRGPIQISEVPQTSQSTVSSAQGSLAGKAMTAGGGFLFNRFFEEPGILMVLCSVVPKSSYQNGTSRQWLYKDSFDFPNPYFAHLGEQVVYNAEVFQDGSDNDFGTFGYQPRYYEMKDIPDSVHGLLRTSLSYWHMGRIFDSLPNLNTNFVKVYQEEFNRIFPTLEQSSDKLIGEFFFNIKCKRKLPYYGVPRFTSGS